MDSVPLIIPLLEKEYRSTTRKLNETNQELRLLKVTFFFFLSLLDLNIQIISLSFLNFVFFFLILNFVFFFFKRR